MEKNLTSGNTYKQLFSLALPIMGTSLIQMSYNISDMFWLGRLSTQAVAAAGMAGFLVWLSMSMANLAKVGAEVGTGQSMGERDESHIRGYIENSLGLGLLMSLVYVTIVLIFRVPILSFFRVEDPSTVTMAETYLIFVMLGNPFHMLSVVMTGIYHGFGNSGLTFRLNTIGLVLNIILDPLLMFTFKLGIAGAAIATSISQTTIFVLFLMASRRNPHFHNIHILKGLKGAYLRRITRFGAPLAVQNTLFALVSSIIARYINSYGEAAFAAQQIGLQIESIGWLSFLGLSTSLSVFTAQNVGARKADRVREGIRKGYVIAAAMGFITGILIYFFKRPIFHAFIHDEETIQYGIIYLTAMTIAQPFSAIEAAAIGSLGGMGEAIYAGITSIIGNVLRIPLALALMPQYGVAGIFYAITISCMIKGLLPQYFVHRKASTVERRFAQSKAL